MNIIIIGAGDIGYNLAKMLSYEKHDIFLIEKNHENYARAVDTLDANVFHGSGTSFTLLEQAGIKDAGLLVAVTDSDEVNLLAAISAKQYGVEKAVARVKNREFLRTDAPINAQKFNIDLIIHPESVAAQGTVRLLKQSAATDVIEFAKGQIILMGIQLDRSTSISNIPLSDLSKMYPDFAFRIIAIHRKDTTKIPWGNDILKPNDRIFVIVARENIQDVVRITGKENVKIEDVMILGGGQTGYIIAHELEKEYNVKIINERNRKIVGISIGMVGTEYEIEIDKNSAGEESSCLVFNLPVLEGEMGKSWGDLFGYYTINGSVRDFFIYNYEHEFKTVTIIRISSEYFRTEFTNSLDCCFTD